MDSKQTLIKELSRLAQQQAQLRLSYDQKTLEIQTRRETILSELLPGYCPDKSMTASPEKSSVKEDNYAAIENGRKISTHELSHINEEDFDLIIDITTNTLKFRKNPAKKTRLKKANLKGVGPHRMHVFARMIARPGYSFHGENIGKDCVSGSRETARNTFAKSLCELRKVVGQTDFSGPYIIKRFDWNGASGGKRSCLYKIDTKWSYLLIYGGSEIS